jgi:hypothetical protein
LICGGRGIISIPDDAICVLPPQKHYSWKENKLHNTGACPFIGSNSLCLNSLQCDHTACLRTAYSVTTQHVSEQPTMWPYSMSLNSLQCDHTACLWTAYSVTIQRVSEQPTVWPHSMSLNSLQCDHTACLWTAYSVTTQHVSEQPTVWPHRMSLNSLQCDHTACLWTAYSVTTQHAAGQTRYSVRSLPFRSNLTLFKTQWLLCVPPGLLPIIFCLLPAQCLRASCMGLRRNSDYFTIPHQLIGF